METPNNQWDRVYRYFGEVAFEHLAHKIVAIVGLGSGGGKVALELAKAGVGCFILVDPEVLEPQNLVRHVLDSDYLGQPKVDGVKSLILKRNHLARVVTVQDKAQNAQEQLAAADLFLVCVDSEPARHSVNMLARQMGVPAITAGVYEKARGGDIFIVLPDDGPCYSCIASVLSADTPTAIPANLDYGAVREDGTLQGQPGLGLHVEQIALRQADFALRQLLALTQSPMAAMPGNVFVIANDPLDNIGTDEQGGDISLQIGEARWFTFERDPSCQVCGLKPQEVPQPVNSLLKQL